MQPAPYPVESSRPRARVRRGEAGIGLVELMVVLVIVAILMSIAYRGVEGSRSAGSRAELKAAAQRYADAVERFKADNGRRVPEFGTDAWPRNDAFRGPVTVVRIGATPTTKYYVKEPLPEIVQRGGRYGGAIIGAGSPIPQHGGALVYERRTAYQFAVTAYWDGEVICASGDVAENAIGC